MEPDEVLRAGVPVQAVFSGRNLRKSSALRAQATPPSGAAQKEPLSGDVSSPKLSGDDVRVSADFTGSLNTEANYAYWQAHDVSDILRDFTLVLLQRKPSKVIAFMAQWAVEQDSSGAPGAVVPLGSSDNSRAPSNVRPSMSGRLDEGLLQPALRPVVFYSKLYVPHLSVENFKEYLLGFTVPSADEAPFNGVAMATLISRMDDFLQSIDLADPVEQTHAAAVYTYTCELYDTPPQWGVLRDDRQLPLDDAVAKALEDAYSRPEQHVQLIASASRVKATLGQLRSKEWRSRHLAGLVQELPQWVVESGHPGLFADCGWQGADKGFGTATQSLEEVQCILKRLISQERLDLPAGSFLVNFSIGDETLLPLSSSSPLAEPFREGLYLRLFRTAKSCKRQIYREMNEAMRQNTNVERWRYLIYCLDRALERLPKLNASQVFRGVGLHFDVTGDYREGAAVCWPAFSSSSASQEVADDFIKQNTKTGELQDGTVFIIRPDSCRDVSCWSRFPREKECLFPSNSRFQVMKNLGSATQKMIDLSSQIMELEEVTNDEIQDMELRRLIQHSPSGVKSIVSQIAETKEPVLKLAHALETYSAEERAAVVQCIAVRFAFWTAVDLGGSTFGDVEALHFGDAIESLTDIQSVSLKAATFQANALSTLLTAISRAAHCQRLALLGRLPQEAIDAIVQALQGKKEGSSPLPLTHLTLASCELPASAVLQIVSSVPRDGLLTSLDLSGNAAVFTEHRTKALGALLEFKRPLAISLAAPEAGEKVRAFTKLKQEVWSVALDTVHNRLAVGTIDGFIRIYDFLTGATVLDIERGERAIVSFSPTGSHFICTAGVMGMGTWCYDENLTLLWRDCFYGSKPRFVAWRRDQPSELAIANSGDHLLILSMTPVPGPEGETYILARETAEKSATVAYNPVQPMLAVPSKGEKKVHVIPRPPANVAKKRSIDVSQEPVLVDFSVDGTLLLIGTSMFTLVVDVNTFAKVLELNVGCCGGSKRPLAAFTPDGQYIAVYSPYVSPQRLVFWHIQDSIRSPVVEARRKGVKVRVHTGVRGLEIKAPDVQIITVGTDMQHLCFAQASEVTVWSTLNRQVDYFLCCGAVSVKAPACEHFKPFL